MSMSSLLTITIFLPLIGAGLLFLLPVWSREAARVFALVTALATLGLSLVLLTSFDAASTASQFRTDAPWIGVGGGSIQFALGLDGISLWLFVLSTVLV